MYLYGKPYPQRDGWHYWGRHYPTSATPEIVGPFETEQQARDHAATNGYGRMDRPNMSQIIRGLTAQMKQQAPDEVPSSEEPAHGQAQAPLHNSL